jgi:hypothetical protein
VTIQAQVASIKFNAAPLQLGMGFVDLANGVLVRGQIFVVTRIAIAAGVVIRDVCAAQNSGLKRRTFHTTDLHNISFAGVAGDKWINALGALFTARQSALAGFLCRNPLRWSAGWE